MKKLTTTLCLTLFVLLGSAGCGNLPKILEKNSYGSEGGELPPCPGRYSKSIWTDCSGYVQFHGGVEYHGEFKNDKMHGQGTHTHPNGNKYVGEFVNGMQHGQGTYTGGAQSKHAGIKYVGEWRKNKQHGQGTATSANGNKYIGEFRDGKPHGQGTLTSADGIKVVSEFRDGKPHGKVTITHPNGNKYVGDSKDNKLHGQATYTYADGSVDKGIWDLDKFKYARKASPTQKQPEQSPSNSPLDKAEKKCAEIGFTKGTEKYGDCVMKLLN